MLLGRPWIHEMQAVPLIYHQCIKFPHHGEEIIIEGDPNPFQYCNVVQINTDNQVPSNQDASIPSSSDFNPKDVKREAGKIVIQQDTNVSSNSKIDLKAIIEKESK